MEKVTVPVEAMACKIPTEAEELCRTAVTTAPKRTPRIGLLNIKKISWKAGESLSGERADSMVVMPKKRIPKPISRWAMFLVFLRLLTRIMKEPMAITIGAKEVGLISSKKS